jgi:hypothetical protein
MCGSDDKQIGPCEDLAQLNQVRIRDVRVGAQYALTNRFEYIAKSVRE